jgi:hypothetical protein
MVIELCFQYATRPDRTAVIACNPDETVHNVLHRLEQEHQLPADLLILKVGERDLNHEEALSAQNINENTVVTVHFNQNIPLDTLIRHAGYLPTRVFTPLGIALKEDVSKRIAVTLKENETLNAYIKRVMEENPIHYDVKQPQPPNIPEVLYTLDDELAQLGIKVPMKGNNNKIQVTTKITIEI